MLWRTKLNDAVRGTPTLAADGTLYVSSKGSPDRLAAVNPDGSIRWNVSVVTEIVSAVALAEDGTLYFGDSTPFLHAYQSDGSVRWETRLEDRIASSPAVGPDGAIYVGCVDGRVYCVNPSGSVRWAFLTGGTVSSSPALGADGTVYIGSNDHKLYALKPDGTKRWEFTTGQFLNTSPALGADGTIYFGGVDGKLYALKPDGKVRWSVNPGLGMGSPALGADGTIYVPQGFSLAAYSAQGAFKWAYPLGGRIYSGPAVAADGTAYLGAESGRFAAVKANGDVAWEFVPGTVFLESSPLVGPDGTVYIGSGDGYLTALRGSGPPAASSWPMFRRQADRGGALPPGGPPVVTRQPEGINVASGSNVVLRASVVGTPPLRYQWRRNDRELRDQCNVSGAQTDTLVIAEALPADTGDYFLVVSNEQGVVGTTPVRLNVLNGFIPPSTVLWEATIGGNTYSSPAVGPDGSVYLATDSGSDDGVLHAFTTNGAPHWTLPLGTQARCSPTLAPDGTLYLCVSYPTNQLLAVDPAGRVKWRFEAGSTLQSAVSLGADGTAYFTANSGTLFAVRTNGTQAWRFETEAGAGISTPSLASDGTIYVGAGKPLATGGTAGVFYALNPDGTEKWRFESPRGPFSATPAIAADGTILAASFFNDGMLYALSPDGRKLWELKTGASLRDPVIAPNGTIYVANLNQVLWSVRPDGKTNWALNTQSPRISIPALSADGALHFVDSYSKLRAWAPSGRELWSVEIGGNGSSSPALDSAGRLLVGAWGKLVAVAASGPPPATGWPMFSRDPTHRANATFALPTPPPQPSNLGIVDGKLQFKVVDPLGNCLVVEVSTNLVSWTSVSTNRPNETFTEVNADVATRFYRVRGLIPP